MLFVYWEPLGLCTLSIVRNSKYLDTHESEIGSVYVFSWGEEDTCYVGSLERPNIIFGLVILSVMRYRQNHLDYVVTA
jgi:hypothetical protein